MVLLIYFYILTRWKISCVQPINIFPIFIYSWNIKQNNLVKIQNLFLHSIVPAYLFSFCDFIENFTSVQRNPCFWEDCYSLVRFHFQFNLLCIVPTLVWDITPSPFLHLCFQAVLSPMDFIYARESKL